MDDMHVDVHSENLARTAQGRSSLYGFLARIFRKELDAETIKEFRSDGFRNVFSELDIELEEAFLKEPVDKLIDVLAVEYTALFLGPGGHISPHESVQRGDGSLWGPETSAVKSYIQAAGMRYDKQNHDMPDHISTELEFMGNLVDEETNAWMKGDLEKVRNALEFQKDFLAKHLGLWAGGFFSKVADRTEVPFYREISRLAADFIIAEETEIETRLAIL